MKFLVSGVAGDIGFGVGRILRSCRSDATLHGMDIHENHAGECVFDSCVVAPPASSADYINWVGSYAKQNEIDFFIPTSEAEIKRLASESIDSIGGAQILLTNRLTIDKSLDKHVCLKFLAEHGLAVPKNGLIGKNEPSSYPVIVKPRSGQGSKGLLTIDNSIAFGNLEVKGAVWQEYLLPDDEEYTCPVYRSPNAGTRILVLKRKLQGGLTGSGEVVEIESIKNYVHSIADTLNLNGVMNVQLRLTSKGPLLFEINPRLSSTLVFRDKLGFCDLRWWLIDKLRLPMPEYDAPLPGTKFYRGAQEYIIPLQSVEV